jgi:hypothetical protein
MSFLTGKVQTVGPKDVTGLRQGLINFLATQGPQSAFIGGPVDISPYMQLFQSSLAPVLAQAKESAGTLTGSGLGNIIGTAAGRAGSDFILNLLSQRADQMNRLFGALATQGFGAAYRPGFLEYLFQGVGQSAPLIASLLGGGVPR